MRTKRLRGYKILTHDYRPPLQGGAPIWDGTTLPVTLPRVTLDTSDKECAAGWNFVGPDDLAHGITIAGLWPAGWPSVVLDVEAEAAIQRGRKWRAAQLTIVDLTDETHITAAVAAICMPLPHSDRVTAETLAWRAALARPRRDPAGVAAGLTVALAARGLPWSLRRFETASATQITRAAWTARDARDALHARNAWNPWDAWDAWVARNAWEDWEAWDAWNAWNAAWEAWEDWTAGSARAALAVFTARHAGRQAGDPLAWTRGIRDAYAAGLAVALPTGPGELGWAMVGERGWGSPVAMATRTRRPTFPIVDVVHLSPCRRCRVAWARVQAPYAGTERWTKRCEAPACLAGLDLTRASIYRATPDPGPFAPHYGQEGQR